MEIANEKMANGKKNEKSDYAFLAERLFSESTASREDIEKRYPPRELPEGAMVTRFAPSPTGMMHLGGLYTAIISERLAHQSGGIFYMRVEDTDQEREVAGAERIIVESLEKYGIKPDEGKNVRGEDYGSYGPYKQSERKDVYRAYARWMVERGFAYPCFCTEAEKAKISEEQKARKLRPGYYGEWAKCRSLSQEETIRTIEAGKPFAIRYKSDGDIEKRVRFRDAAKGEFELPENDQDAVLLKSNGLPTYDFAHVVDDYLMGPTTVIRADEYLSHVTLDMRIAKSLGIKPFTYGHISPIMKMGEKSKRKLSKREDPEANVLYFEKKGYPVEAVTEYLLNLANSNFEDWRRGNPNAGHGEFKVTMDKLSTTGGALFDNAKLDSVSREIIAKMNADEIYKMGLDWAGVYNTKLGESMKSGPDYTKAILNIERGGDHTRKDVAKWSDLENEIGYFYDEHFNADQDEIRALLSKINLDDAKAVIKEFLAVYNPDDTKDEWFSKLKNISVSLGFAEDLKSFKKNPEKFKGYVGDIALVLRAYLTGKATSPNLYQIMKVMGRDRVASRLQKGL